MAKWCALSPGKLPRGGLPKNSVDRITDRPDMTSAVYRGRKEPTKTNKQALKKKQSADRIFVYLSADKHHFVGRLKLLH